MKKKAIGQYSGTTEIMARVLRSVKNQEGLADYLAGEMSRLRRVERIIVEQPKNWRALFRKESAASNRALAAFLKTRDD